MLLDKNKELLTRSLIKAGFPITPISDIHKSHLISPNGNRTQAIAAFRQYLDHSPDDIAALDNMAYLLQLMGENQLSAEYRTQAVRKKVANMNLHQEEQDSVLKFMLAREGLASQPDRCPQKYTIDKFDSYADTFDDHLRNKLEYQGPEKLLELLKQTVKTENQSLDILDLGCGTGISGETFLPLAKTLTGVDFSAGMLAKARQREIYDVLLEQDLVNALWSLNRQYDLILAADVFIYLGALDSVFEHIGERLKTNAHFLFSVEKSQYGNYRLHAVGRYAHSIRYIETLAQKYSFHIRNQHEFDLRKELGQPVCAFGFLLQKTN